MKYWLFGPSSTDFDALQIFAIPDVSYVKKTITLKAEKKNIQGVVIDDYLFVGGEEVTVSTRVAKIIESLSLEGIEVWDYIADLPDKIYKDTWKYIVVANHVDCIDFKNSEIDYDEDFGTIDFIDKLVIDEQKADLAGYHMFRLHDDFPTIVVSDYVKQAIEAIHPVGIDFDPTDGTYIKE